MTLSRLSFESTENILSQAIRSISRALGKPPVDSKFAAINQFSCEKCGQTVNGMRLLSGSRISVFLFWLLWICSSAWGSAGVPATFLGQPVVQVYNNDDFQGSATNWFVQQNEQGVIFLSNGNGLFSFDGAHWHQLMASQNIRQFVLADHGRIYIAAESEFGYLDPQPNGVYQYHSLLDALKASDRSISDVNNTYRFEDMIYFFTPEQIMRYRPGQGIEVIKPKKRFSRAWKTPDKLFFNDGRELHYFAQGKIHTIAPLDSSKITGFGFIQKIGAEAYILGTFSKGIYLWKDNAITTLVAPDTALAGQGFYNSLRLDDDKFAVASIRGGVYIFNHRAEVLYHLDHGNGLPVDIAVNLYLDRQQGLWVPMEGALARVQLPFNLSIFPARTFNIAKVKGFARVGDKIYLAAVNGVRTIDAQGAMKIVPGAINSAAVIRQYRDMLLLGGAAKCQVLKPASGHLDTLLRAAYCKDIRMARRRHGDVLLMTERGMWSSRFEQGKWSRPRLFFENNQINSLLVQDAQGDFWTSTSTGKVVRLYHLDGQWRYQTSAASTAGITMLGWKGRVMVATDKGLFYWDKQNRRLGQSVAWFKRFFGVDAATPTLVFEDSHQRLWVNTDEKSGYLALQNGKPQSWHNYPVAAAGLHSLRAVYEEGEVTWLGFDNGVARYVARKGEQLNPATLMVTQLRDAQNGAVIQQSTGAAALRHMNVTTPGRPLLLDFALTSYLHSDKNRYRYRFDDDPWSPWDDRATISINKKYGANLSLQLEAKDFQSRQYRVGDIRLVIASPWYATTFALVLYGLLLLALLWLVALRFAAFKTRKLRQRQALLEDEVEQRTEKIRQQSEQLQRLNEAKSRFFANVSHEFRTPLTLAIGPLEALKKDPDIQSPTARQHIRVALDNSRRMLALVGQILDINRLENGEMTLAVTTVNLKAVLQKMIRQFSVVAEQNDIAIELAMDDLADIWFDEDHLYKICSNLLSNAVKFSPPHSVIRVDVIPLERDRLEISVSDQGPGIAEDERDQLFTRFFQGKNSSSYLQPGTGIGLAMVKELLELHHGHIELDESYHAGCRFRVILQRGKSHYAEKDLLDFTHTPVPAVHELPHLLEPDIQPLRVEDATDSGIPEHSPTVLVVDDNQDLRAFIKTTLASAYHCIEAENGVAALQLLDKVAPDFIICDVMMPQMDGIEFTRRIKAEVDTAHIPLLLLTAKATKRDTVHGLQQGADDYLSKPFDSSELIARIDAHLQQKQHISQAIYQQFMQTLPAPANDDEGDSFKHRFHQLIIEKISDSDFDIAAMSSAMNMERSTLFRKVRQTFDCTPNQYLKSQRLKMALQMLRKNSGSISEIAYAVGFQSLNYFSRSFRDQYQVSPSSYEKIPHIA